METPGEQGLPPVWMAVCPALDTSDVTECGLHPLSAGELLKMLTRSGVGSHEYTGALGRAVWMSRPADDRWGRKRLGAYGGQGKEAEILLLGCLGWGPALLPWLIINWRLVVKNLPARAGNLRDLGSIPESGRSPEGGNGNPLQYSCLENPWAEEPGRLQSSGSQRVGRNWSDLTPTVLISFYSRCFEILLNVAEKLQEFSFLSFTTQELPEHSRYPDVIIW